MKNAKVYYWIPVLALTVATLTACQKQDAATVVQQRAAERWKLLIADQPIKAYDYQTPGYRSIHTLDQYVAFVGTSKVKWKDVKVVRGQCDAEICTVNLIVDATVPAVLAQTPHDLKLQSPIVERWIVSDGQWYFLPESQSPSLKGEIPGSADMKHDATSAPDTSPAPAAPVQPAPVPAPAPSGGNDK